MPTPILEAARAAYLSSPFIGIRNHLLDRAPRHSTPTLGLPPLLPRPEVVSFCRWLDGTFPLSKRCTLCVSNCRPAVRAIASPSTQIHKINITFEQFWSSVELDGQCRAGSPLGPSGLMMIAFTAHRKFNFASTTSGDGYLHCG